MLHNLQLSVQEQIQATLVYNRAGLGVACILLLVIWHHSRSLKTLEAGDSQESWQMDNRSGGMMMSSFLSLVQVADQRKWGSNEWPSPSCKWPLRHATKPSASLLMLAEFQQIFPGGSVRGCVCVWCSRQYQQDNYNNNKIIMITKNTNEAQHTTPWVTLTLTISIHIMQNTTYIF